MYLLKMLIIVLCFKNVYNYNNFKRYNLKFVEKKFATRVHNGKIFNSRTVHPENTGQ